MAFWCERAPWLGGETALFDGAGALAALPPALRARLSRSFAVRRVVSDARLRRRHGLNAGALLAARARGARGVGVRRVAGAGAVELTFEWADSA